MILHQPVRKGVFITLEGGEGAGKSTQIRKLAEVLQQRGISVGVTREPGGSVGAERIRDVLLAPENSHFDPLTQAFLFAAARRDHLLATVIPALRSGQWVICDRFADSTRAYQGAGGALSTPVIEKLIRLACGRLKPDLTLILDIDPALGMARARKRAGKSLATSDSFERQALSFHHRVREGFREIALREPQRCIVIDASKSAEDVADHIRGAVEQRLGKRLPV